MCYVGENLISSDFIHIIRAVKTLPFWSDKQRGYETVNYQVGN